MKRIRTKLITPLLLLSTGVVSAAHIDEDQAANQLAAEFATRLHQVRYMESGPPRDVTVPGWEGLPTKRYTYSVKDKDGTTKSADVILLDPSADQIARWIVQAIVEVTGAYDPDAGRRAFKNVIAQSGGQFPVAGVVYEDIIPADGLHEVYCFRDGVTVEVEGVKHRTTTPLTPREIDASISGPVKRVFTYARIQSTSPKMWIDAGGSPTVLGPDNKPTNQWRTVIRDEFKKAWTSPRNALMVAWIKSQNTQAKSP